MPPPPATLLIITGIAVAGLISLIAKAKLNSFIAIALASLFVGVCSGMELTAIAKAFQSGVGTVLGDIAMVVALGTILGKMLAESGGADVVAGVFNRVLGPSRAPWTVFAAAIIIGIPTFFGVGLILLLPIVFTLVRQTNLPLLALGIPLVAALSTMHGLVPPHPGPMAAIGTLGANVGKTILYSLIVGIPVALVAGPLFGKLLAKHVPVELSGGLVEQFAAKSERKNSPGFGLTVFTILLPVALMLVTTVVDLRIEKRLREIATAHPPPKESKKKIETQILPPELKAEVEMLELRKDRVDFVGHPFVSMLIAVLFSYWSFGFARGFNRGQIAKFSTDCLMPLAAILLIIGAGGGFKEILTKAGVASAIGDIAKKWDISPLVFGWLVAAMIRIATGSATVAVQTAAAIVVPLADKFPGTNRELLVVSMGAGSLILSHVNDGGFWLVKEYFNMTVPQTLKTWTAVETVISVLALAGVLLLNQVV